MIVVQCLCDFCRKAAGPPLAAAHTFSSEVPELPARVQALAFVGGARVHCGLVKCQICVTQDELCESVAEHGPPAIPVVGD